jgi:hypothetical protein
VVLAAGTGVTRTVTTTLDGGAGSLRQAILDAQSGDDIVFSSSVFNAPMTLQLAGQIEISTSLTIDGAGLGVVTPTLNSSFNRTFQVNSGASVTFNRLIFSNSTCSGCMGGAIYVASNATVTITHASLTGNIANAGGAIYNDGNMRLSDTTITNNKAIAGGGAIRNRGTLTANRIIIGGNTAEYGGAIQNWGNVTPAVLTLNNSAIYNNSAISGTGATGYGGGIHNIYPASMVMTNTTLVNNSAAMDGGAIWNGGLTNLKIVNATIYANTSTGSGSEITNAGQVTLTNSIIAGSTGGNCAGSGTFIDLGGNLEDANSCGLGTFQTTASRTMVNPLLGAFGNNPPGYIPTMALLRGSPAINAAIAAACPPTDARGISRQQGGHCDIGAYEAFANFTFVPLALR